MGNDSIKVGEVQNDETYKQLAMLGGYSGTNLAAGAAEAKRLTADGDFSQADLAQLIFGGDTTRAGELATVARVTFNALWKATNSDGTYDTADRGGVQKIATPGYATLIATATKAPNPTRGEFRFVSKPYVGTYDPSSRTFTGNASGVMFTLQVEKLKRVMSGEDTANFKKMAGAVMARKQGNILTFVVAQKVGPSTVYFGYAIETTVSGNNVSWKAAPADKQPKEYGGNKTIWFDRNDGVWTIKRTPAEGVLIVSRRDATVVNEGAFNNAPAEVKPEEIRKSSAAVLNLIFQNLGTMALSL